MTGALIDRFGLQQAYHKRYRVDTEKYLARHTSISEDDKKSGVITLTVTDTDPARARDLAQGLSGPTESAPEPDQHLVGASRTHLHRTASCFR